jgi:hypothetical protein
LGGFVVDREQRVLPLLGEHNGQGAQAGGAAQLTGLLFKRDPAVLFECEQDGALDADLLGVGGKSPSKVCSA